MMIQGMLPNVPSEIDGEILIREDSEASKEFRKKLFSHPEFKSRVGKYITFFVKRGIIDFNDK